MNIKQLSIQLLASHPGLLHLQLLITCSTQERKEKVWESDHIIHGMSELGEVSDSMLVSIHYIKFLKETGLVDIHVKMYSTRNRIAPMKLLLL